MDNIFLLLLFVGLAAIVIVPIVIVTNKVADVEARPCEFEVGQKVQHVLDKRMGIIVDINKLISCTKYRVRFPALTVTTNTRLLGPDGAADISPYSCDWYRAFELELAKENKSE